MPDEGEGGMQTPPGASGSLERHSPQGRRASEGKMPWLDLGKSAQGMLTLRALFKFEGRGKVCWKVRVLNRAGARRARKRWMGKCGRLQAKLRGLRKNAESSLVTMGTQCGGLFPALEAPVQDT